MKGSVTMTGIRIDSGKPRFEEMITDDDQRVYTKRYAGPDSDME